MVVGVPEHLLVVVVFAMVTWVVADFVVVVALAVKVFVVVMAGAEVTSIMRTNCGCCC